MNVLANKAPYDIQFGNTLHPTLKNTTLDKAKFEVSGHKWADILDNGYDFSPLNNCKFGHSAEGSTLKLTYLKSTKFPDSQADKHVYGFTYALLCHTFFGMQN